MSEIPAQEELAPTDEVAFVFDPERRGIGDRLKNGLSRAGRGVAIVALSAAVLLSACGPDGGGAAEDIGEGVNVELESNFNPEDIITTFDELEREQLDYEEQQEYDSVLEATSDAELGLSYSANEKIDQEIDDEGDITKVVARDAIEPAIAADALDDAENGNVYSASSTVDTYVDDEGQFTSIDARDAIEPAIAADAVADLKNGNEFSAESTVSTYIDDEGTYTQEDAQKKLDEAA